MRKAWVRFMNISLQILLADLSSQLQSLLKLESFVKGNISLLSIDISKRSHLWFFFHLWYCQRRGGEVAFLINAVIAYMVSGRSICLVEKAGWRQSYFVKSACSSFAVDCRITAEKSVSLLTLPCPEMKWTSQSLSCVCMFNQSRLTLSFSHQMLKEYLHHIQCVLCNNKALQIVQSIT